MRFPVSGLWVGLLTAGILWTSGGCATIYPPPRQPIDPVWVYVADYGVHSSLLLPTGDGRYVEYAFGDWGYAAENHNLPQDAVGALVLSFQAGLGRRFIQVPPGRADPEPTERPWKLSKITCERGDVQALVRRLNERYEAALQTQKPVRNPENGLEFVKDTEHYSVLNNCNHLTARSLEILGCKVRGIVFSSKFQVASSPPRPPDSEPARRPESPVPGWNTASIN